MGKNEYGILIFVVAIMVCQARTRGADRAMRYNKSPSPGKLGKNLTVKNETIVETTNNTTLKANENEITDDWQGFDVSQWEDEDANSTLEEIPLADRIIFGKETDPQKFLDKFVKFKPTRKPYKEGRNSGIPKTSNEQTVKLLNITNQTSCTPLPTKVFAPIKKLKPHTKIFPRCVEVHRCGGCCNDDTHVCEAVEREPVQFEAFILMYTASLTLTAEEKIIVTIQNHTRCACNCKVKAEHCVSPLHMYRADECSCVCKNDMKDIDACQSSPGMIWNMKECRCECAEQVRSCSSGFHFNHTLSCDCLPEQEGENVEITELHTNE